MPEFISYREPDIVPELNNNENSLFIYKGFLRETINSRENIFPKIKFEKKVIKNIEFENLISFTELSSSFDSSIFESNLINPRIDSFISRAIEIAPRVNPGFHRVERQYGEAYESPAQPLPGFVHRRSFKSNSGLQIGLGYSVGGLTIHGSRVVGDGEVARVDFTPGGRAYFAPDRITDSLASGVQGIRELVQAVDEGQIDEIQTLVGTTNINMALIVQRLGFTIVDQDRTPDGNIDVTKGSFTVVARMQDVQARVREFEESGRFDRLQRRYRRGTTSRASDR